MAVHRGRQTSRRSWMVHGSVVVEKREEFQFEAFVDKSQCRRGAARWCKEEGLCEENDRLFIECCIDQLLGKYLAGLACYVEIFHVATPGTSIGQALDLSVVNAKANLDNSTIDTYDTVVKFKNKYFFQAPTASALVLANQFDQAEAIMNYIGRQVGSFPANKHPSNFGSSKLTCLPGSFTPGKNCEDISEGKYTWLIANAFQRATSTQRKVLEEHLGRKQFGLLKICSKYSLYEEESFNVIARLQES